LFWRDLVRTPTLPGSADFRIFGAIDPIAGLPRSFRPGFVKLSRIGTR
jgi:hypothetical protein